MQPETRADPTSERQYPSRKTRLPRAPNCFRRRPIRPWRSRLPSSGSSITAAMRRCPRERSASTTRSIPCAMSSRTDDSTPSSSVDVDQHRRQTGTTQQRKERFVALGSEEEQAVGAPAVQERVGALRVAGEVAVHQKVAPQLARRPLDRAEQAAHVDVVVLVGAAVGVEEREDLGAPLLHRANEKVGGVVKLFGGVAHPRPGVGGDAVQLALAAQNERGGGGRNPCPSRDLREGLIVDLRGRFLSPLEFSNFAKVR